ncbi:hypothetical protein LP419_21430 [Massilia sp. H-1]|nr:hypothetical protein LP419_21430 [Massilia sp. H-1]
MPDDRADRVGSGLDKARQRQAGAVQINRRDVLQFGDQARTVAQLFKRHFDIIGYRVAAIEKFRQTRPVGKPDVRSG